MSTEWNKIKAALGPGEVYKGRFEYRVESRPRHPQNPPTRDDLIGWLNGFGSSGWQLCAVYEDNYGTSEFFFKRQLP